MKTKKILLMVLSALLLVCLFPLAASALSTQDTEQALFDASDTGSLLGSLDDETASLLDKLGLGEISADALGDISPRRVIQLIFDIMQGKLRSIAKYASVLLGILVLIALIDTFVDEGQATAVQFQSLYTIFFALAVSAPLVSCVRDVLSAIQLTTDFSLLLIPVFAGVITASGSPALALSYHSLAFALAQLISQIAGKYLSVFMGINLSLCVTGAMSPLLKTQNITTQLKRIVTVVLGLSGTLFVGLLSIKNLLANAADSLTYKSAKFLFGSFVPVVGSAVGDGLASVLASLSMLNATVGVVGMLVIALICLPTFIELLLWWLVLNICAFAAGLLGRESIANLLQGLSSVIVMLNVVLIFTGFVLILSIGLTLNIKKTG